MNTNTTTEQARIDPGLPGLYECHFLYSIGKEKFLRYIVVLLTAPNFKRAYDLGLMQLELMKEHKQGEIKLFDNLLNLVTDPVDYLQM